MPEFPALGYRRSHAVIGTGSPNSSVIAQHVINCTTIYGAGAVWPAANRAFYYHVIVDDWVTVFQMSVQVTTQNGNLDVGIYDEQFNRLVSSGSTAVGAAGIQTVNITDTILPPGGYYLAMNCDSGTAAFQRASVAAPVQEALGIKQQDVGALALPATGTPAVSAATTIPFLVAHLNATV